jgi:hypothetical protein
MTFQDVKVHMNVLRTACIAASVILISCASAPAAFDRLTDASGQVIFALDDGVQVKTGSDPIYLARGGYRVIKSGPEGSMYAGPEFGVVRKSVRGYLGYPGGVWIPRDPNAMAKIFVFVGLGERLYPNLTDALTLPAEAERKMVEQAALEGIDYTQIKRSTCAEEPLPPSGAFIGPASVALLCAIFEYQRGKPDVIGELSGKDLEKLIGPAAPAKGRP